MWKKGNGKKFVFFPPYVWGYIKKGHSHCWAQMIAHDRWQNEKLLNLCFLSSSLLILKWLIFSPKKFRLNFVIREKVLKISRWLKELLVPLQLMINPKKSLGLYFITSCGSLYSKYVLYNLILVVLLPKAKISLFYSYISALSCTHFCL